MIEKFDIAFQSVWLKESLSTFFIIENNILSLWYAHIYYRFSYDVFFPFYNGFAIWVWNFFKDLFQIGFENWKLGHSIQLLASLWRKNHNVVFGYHPLQYRISIFSWHIFIIDVLNIIFFIYRFTKLVKSVFRSIHTFLPFHFLPISASSFKFVMSLMVNRPQWRSRVIKCNFGLCGLVNTIIQMVLSNFISGHHVLLLILYLSHPSVWKLSFFILFLHLKWFPHIWIFLKLVFIEHFAVSWRVHDFVWMIFQKWARILHRPQSRWILKKTWSSGWILITYWLRINWHFYNENINYKR